MADCLFCQIVQKKIPAKIVFEDQQVLAFEDINPQAPVHLLVIPRKHLATLNEVSGPEEGLAGICWSWPTGSPKSARWRSRDTVW